VITSPAGLDPGKVVYAGIGVGYSVVKVQIEPLKR
jgi:hypothetical protein